MTKRRVSKPELKIYSFFSDTARAVGLKTEDVEEVYLWAIREMKKSLKEEPVLSVNLNNFGKFITNRRVIFKTAFERVYLMKEMIIIRGPERLKLSSLEYHASVLMASIKLIRQLKKVPKYAKQTSSYDILRKRLEDLRTYLNDYNCEGYPNLEILKTNEQLF